jgi:hypothetical protein
VPNRELPPRRQEALKRLEREFTETKRQLSRLGFVLQGSLSERRMLCGKAGCRCRSDPDARHGPYFQWSRKIRAKTVSSYLSHEQATTCKDWIRNNRDMEKIIKRLRQLSLRAARLFEIPPK